MVTIHQLLDMTSPIPGYDNEVSIGKIMAQSPNHDFTPEELVASVYPRGGKPKPVSGWTYSNTNYILAQMIIEKASGQSYSEVVRGLFDQTGLKNTYYEQNRYPTSITNRMVSGYFYNHDADNAVLKPLLGHDVKNDSVSWMQAAGGIVSQMDDVTRWSRDLYEGPLLAEKQRKELTTIVSIKTGKPIANTSKRIRSASGSESDRPPNRTSARFGTTKARRSATVSCTSTFPRTRASQPSASTASPTQTKARSATSWTRFLRSCRMRANYNRLYSYSRYLRRIDSKSATPAAH